MSDLMSLAGTEAFLPKRRNLHPRIYSSALFPSHLLFPTPQHWPRLVNPQKDSGDSLGCSLVPFSVAGKKSGEIWKYRSELKTSWEPDENHWGHHRPFLQWLHNPCVLLHLGGRYLQTQQGESCTACAWPACSPALWGTEPGWVRKVLRKTIRVGGSCPSQLEAHLNAVNSLCRSPVRQLLLLVLLWL